MKKAINAVLRVCGSIRSPRGYFSMRSGERRYKSPGYAYPCVRDAWQADWNNIASDFRRAVVRLGLAQA